MEPEKHKNEEVIIRISGLSNGLHAYHFSAEPFSIGLDSNFRKNIEIDAQLDKTTSQIYLKTNIQASGLYQCDRCLDEFEQNITTTYNMFYVFNQSDSDKYPTDEIQVISPDSVNINLTEDIRQLILLSVPLKLLCSQECKGLCPSCGTNWNHKPCDCSDGIRDPRWQGLKDILNK